MPSSDSSSELPGSSPQRTRRLRALRGAITVDRDDKGEVLAATTRLLETMAARNPIDTEDLVSIMFTATKDIRSVPPAVAARTLGLVDVPLICTQEMDVEGGLGMCVRVIAHLETDRTRDELRHVFLRGAVALRPELAEPGDEA